MAQEGLPALQTGRCAADELARLCRAMLVSLRVGKWEAGKSGHRSRFVSGKVGFLHRAPDNRDALNELRVVEVIPRTVVKETFEGFAGCQSIVRESVRDFLGDGFSKFNRWWLHVASMT